MSQTVEFQDCSNCGRGWSVATDEFWTEDQVLKTQRFVDDFFEDHLCLDCATNRTISDVKYYKEESKMNYIFRPIYLVVRSVYRFIFGMDWQEDDLCAMRGMYWTKDVPSDEELKREYDAKCAELRRQYFWWCNPLQRLPVIRHIRGIILNIRVNLWARMWYGAGMGFGVCSDSDVLMIRGVFYGKW